MKSDIEERIAVAKTDEEFAKIAKEIVASPPDHSVTEVRLAEKVIDFSLRYQVPKPGKTFEEELMHLANRYSMENGSDTPDFALAAYLVACLDAYGKAVRERDKWFNFDPWGKAKKEMKP